MYESCVYDRNNVCICWVLRSARVGVCRRFDTGLTQVINYNTRHEDTNFLFFLGFKKY